MDSHQRVIEDVRLAIEYMIPETARATGRAQLDRLTTMSRRYGWANGFIDGENHARRLWVPIGLGGVVLGYLGAHLIG